MIYTTREQMRHHAFNGGNEKNNKSKVLILSSDRRTRFIIANILHVQGIKAENIFITDLMHSVEAYNKFSPHAVIADKYFAKFNIDGRQALRPLTRREPGIDPIFISQESMRTGSSPESHIVDVGAVYIPLQAIVKKPDILMAAIARVSTQR